MKKVILALVVCFMLLTLTSCDKITALNGYEITEETTIKDLNYKGYRPRFDNGHAGKVACFEFKKDNSHVLVYVECDEEFYNQLSSNFTSIGEMIEDRKVVLIDVTSEFPSQKELEKYTDKTIGDLMNEGFHSFSYGGVNYNYSRNGNVAVSCKKGNIYYSVALKDKTEDSKEEFYSMNDEDFSNLKIRKVDTEIYAGKCPPNPFIFEEATDKIKQSPLYEYFTNGYYVGSSAGDGFSIECTLENDKLNKALFVKAACDETTFIEFFSEWALPFNTTLARILCSLDDVEIVDVSDQIPSKESYVGKTFEEFLNNGYTIEDNLGDGVFICSKDNSRFYVYLAVRQNLEQPTNISIDEALNKKVAEVKFGGCY